MTKKRTRGSRNYPKDQKKQIQDQFLELIAQGMPQIDAAKLLNMSISTIRSWARLDEAFDKRWLEADKESIPVLVGEVTNRAVHGIKKPVIYRGRRVYETDPITGELILDENGEPIPVYEVEYDNKLLCWLLESKAPELFDRTVRAKKWERDNAVDGEGPANLEDLATLATMLAKIATAKASEVHPDEDVDESDE